MPLRCLPALAVSICELTCATTLEIAGVRTACVACMKISSTSTACTFAISRARLLIARGSAARNPRVEASGSPSKTISAPFAVRALSR